MKAHLLISGHPGFPSPQALEVFVREHARGGLTVRDADMFARTMEEGVVIAIVDDDQDLLAMSAILPLEHGEFEMGAALVRADMTGFYLQRYMIAARLSAAARRNLVPAEKLYAGALQSEAGAGSRAMIEINGFRKIPFDNVPQILQDECLTCTKKAHRLAGERCCYQYYRASGETPENDYLPDQVELENRRDARKLTLVFHHP
ncbi:hypothetical protein [Maricaulis sp.]|uniref:hypothetical protein n=1 Tax=Maricaulis sp. TaxID=1486257 RepID=UPI002633CE58|nr:hypothetical protein [Maricaulis sp.]